MKPIRNERGITKLETVIILIAFAIVMAVFSFAVLSVQKYSSASMPQKAWEEWKQEYHLPLQNGSSIAWFTSTEGVFFSHSSDPSRFLIISEEDGEAKWLAEVGVNGVCVKVVKEGDEIKIYRWR